MLTIQAGSTDSFDESQSKFVAVGGTVLDLEHSLLSLSKWEAMYEKPFLGKEEKSGEEILDYIRCMSLDPDIPPEVFQRLTEKNLQDINAYLESKQSATWFNDQANNAPKSSEVITSELIYYWMTAFNIPFEAESWNLNRLLTLIRVCNLKQAKPKKMSRAEAARRRQELNAQRKQQLGTNG